MDHSTSHGHPYRRLAWMAALSFVAMYWLMYAMVDRLDNVYMSLNQVYMAALMTAPMILLELALMRPMYPSAQRNTAIAAASVALLLLSWVGIRQQRAIGDQQFLRSMIPHHAGAILMCNRAPIADRPLQELCQRIVQGQNDEIAEMKALLHAGN